MSRIAANAVWPPLGKTAGAFRAAWPYPDSPQSCKPPGQSGGGTSGPCAGTRRGVTLVELLVVIMIMLMITAIALPMISPPLKNRDVREAARMIDVFINGARTRAAQYNKSYGIMIERMPGNPNGAVTLSYCEQPDPYSGDYSNSTILTLGNGGFASPAFPMGDAGWIAGPAAPVAPSTTSVGYLTDIAPGDVVTIKGQQFRIWAGEPFIDIDQNGIRSQTDGSVPGTPVGVWEPFLDVDLDGNWTPPNFPGAQSPFVFNPSQPYVDPASGYFVQPNTAASSPFPAITFGTQSAYVTFVPFDPDAATQTISSAFTQELVQLSNGLPPTPYQFAPLSGSFNFVRRPIKTTAPSIQLPGGSVIDFGSNYADTVFNPSKPLIVAIPGSGIEVLAANANALGFWSTFRAQPSLDPTLQGSQAQQGNLPSDPTSIMITFQPTGTLDRVYSWSEAQMGGPAPTSVAIPPNWSDWQGRIPAGPIYLLVGRQELLNGEPDLLPIVPQGKPPLKPIYNVQDPNALWVTINPQTGAVATAENVGYDLTTPIPQNPDPTSPIAQNMPVYWAANVYYARRLARAMLDMGGR